MLSSADVKAALAKDEGQKVSRESWKKENTKVEVNVSSDEEDGKLLKAAEAPPRA